MCSLVWPDGSGAHKEEPVKMITCTFLASAPETREPKEESAVPNDRHREIKRPLRHALSSVSFFSFLFKFLSSLS